MTTRIAYAATGLTALALATASCSSSSLDDSGSGSSSDTITVGYVTPLTGPLAAFGEGDQYVVDQMTAYFKDHPITAGGQPLQVNILLKDSQSDPKRAGEVAADLINTDNVDVLMAHATPETTVPVAAQCEANSVPCITADTPWQPWVVGLGGNPGAPDEGKIKWSHHFFWGLEDMAAVFMDMWSQVPTNKKVGAFYPNDADGQAFTDTKTGFPAIISAQGFTMDNPGLYPSGTQDFTSLISAYKKQDDQLITGVQPPPDFAAFWKQSKQQNYKPKLVTVGKSIEFPAAVSSLGDLAINLGTEVWWAPSYPTTSSLSGVTSQQFADDYESATKKQWNVTLGFSESLFEVMAAAVTKAGGTDKAKINEAIGGLSVDTLVGTLDWTKSPYPNIAKTPLTGGQWRKATGGSFPYELVLVSNAHAKEAGLDVPLGGKVEPTNP
ncbi:MAG: ABC transporter substrate-binding protein [Nostocoides sp.]